jgi:cystathionine beta-synthase
MKKIIGNILEGIGGTPLVRLNKIGAEFETEILVKPEFLNPGGSVKDRMALYIIEQAEKAGRLKPGGIIVENTSGNTGVGVAMAAAIKGYRAIFTMPDKMSQEKINMLKSFGADVVITPTDVPADSPESYYETAKRIARETPGAFYLNQYHNQDNIEAHYHSTGPEIFEQVDGRLDAFIADIGTGGTLSGTARFLKEKIPGIRIIAVDIKGSVFYDYFKTGELPDPFVYQVEGIGDDQLTGAMDFSVVDDMVQVDDRESFAMARRLCTEEGLFAGGSSGSAVAGVIKYLAGQPDTKRVVTVLPDSGSRYLSKFYNNSWMKEKGFVN